MVESVEQIANLIPRHAIIGELSLPGFVKVTDQLKELGALAEAPITLGLPSAQPAHPGSLSSP